MKLAIALTLFCLGGCAAHTNYAVRIVEDESGCRIALSGSDVAIDEALLEADGCILWTGNRCSAHFGDNCDVYMSK